MLRPNNFDLIRLFASCQVMVFHGIEHLQLEPIFGKTFMLVLKSFPGVPIFFFISGFLISNAYEKNSSLKKFATNRALRIFPGLWVCFVVSIISVFIFYPAAFNTVSISRFSTWVAAQLTIFQFYNPEFLRPYGLGALNGSLWSITVELQFYFCIPVIYYLLSKTNHRTNALLLCLIALFLVLNRYYAILNGYDLDENIIFKLLGVSFIPYLWLFLLGILIQRSFNQLSMFFVGLFPVWLLIHAGSVWLAISIGEPHGNNHPFPLAAITLCGLTLAAAYSLPRLSDICLKNNDISYGVYIYHGIVLNVFIHYNWRHDLWPLFLLIVISVALGWLSWRWVERPFLRLKVR